MNPIRSVTNCYHCHLSLLGTKKQLQPSSFYQEIPSHKTPITSTRNQQLGYNWHLINKREARRKLSIQLRVWKGTYHKSTRVTNQQMRITYFLSNKQTAFPFLVSKQKKSLNATASNPVHISRNQNTSGKGEVQTRTELGNERVYTM